MSGLNGKTGELLRWVVTIVVAVLVSYFSAQINTERRMTAVEVKQETQFAEVQRSLARIESQLRDLTR